MCVCESVMRVWMDVCVCVWREGVSRNEVI